MLHICRKCSDIFTSKEHLAKGVFVGFWKDGLLAKIQARTSRSCRFLLFLHHNYQVSLIKKIKFQRNLDGVLFFVHQEPQPIGGLDSTVWNHLKSSKKIRNIYTQKDNSWHGSFKEHDIHKPYLTMYIKYTNSMMSALFLQGKTIHISSVTF